MKYMIGVDVGTTSTNQFCMMKWQFLRKHNIGYDMNTPDVDTSEENPDKIFDAVLMTIKAVIREERIAVDDIKLISFSAQMHSLIAMDNEQSSLTESITWQIIG